jgi:putative oxidoreductase
MSTISGFGVVGITVGSCPQEGFLQRLFTTFADGWPGFGLLVQRLVTGIALLHNGIVLTSTSAGIARQATGAILAIFIMIGLWTPVAGALIAVVEVWIALVYPGYSGMAILLATLGATLAMIGPGAFSIDARLFGRKHISG